MNRYGQSITWSTINAPHLFAGICQRYSYRDARQRQLDDDEAGDFRALIQHSRKAELDFEAKVTGSSTDFLNLAAGGALEVDGISGGVILVRRAVERWVLQQPKTASIQATHYPDMVQASPVLAGTGRSAVTPDQSGLGIVTPGGVLISGTSGLTHAAGVVHELELTQELQITEDDPAPDGTIPGAASHGYMMSLRLRLLATDEPPVTGATLNLTGAPGVAANEFRIEGVDTIYESKRGMMYEIGGVWIPPFD